jgi:UDP-N-acetylmuramoyl-L-alanyl-D-glutamate--2,6-diaminopimelate ligase
MGEFNLSNLAQACVAALRLGLDAASLASAIPLLEPPAGRLEPVAAEPAPTASAQDVRVFIDFAHTDAALERSLAAVRPAVPEGGRLVVVFGCGGDRDRSKRPRMGAAAHRLADRVIVTSDNPRSERPSDIVSDVLSGVPAPDRGAIDVQVERERAIEHAIETAEPGDVIVIAGKGHEREQIFADESGAIVRRPFDDRAIAAAALGRRAERLSRAATVESAAPAGTEAES